MSETLYKVLGPNNESCNGGNAAWSLPVGDSPGDWMPKVRVNPCVSGYHVCTLAQLPQWLRSNVWVVEGSGKMVDHGDKLVYEQARLVRPTFWNKRAARLFAADCAEHVLHIFYRQVSFG